MPYELSKLEPEGTARLLFRGEASRKDNEQAREDLARLCAQAGVKNVLVDFIEAASLMAGATLDLHAFGQTFLPREFPPDLRLAVLAPVHLLADVQFVVNVAWNRGFTMQVFIDRNQAIKWLLA